MLYVNVQDGMLTVGVDVQYDSPGFSATNARATAICLRTGLALRIECLCKQETG